MSIALKQFPSLTNILTFFLFFLIFGLKSLIYSLPLPYRFRRDIFGRHGRMDDFTFSSSVYCQHVTPHFQHFLESYSSLLEIGPGDSCLTALHAFNSGFNNVTLIDKDISSVKSSLKLLERHGHPVVVLGAAEAQCYQLQV